MCAACTSPSMRAPPDTTRVPGCSGSAATLPRTMPSTRSPPLKKTLPSMRVVAPIRLSIRFCGLLGLPNMVFASLPQRDGVGRLRLRRAGLVDPHLHVLDLRLRAHPERPFHPLEVLESQPERGRPGVRLLREAHLSPPAPFRQAHDELEPPLEI